uniref:Kelch-like protein diablo n=1 Tax=Glossina morsitans morsitans TaxID=37546 RepID=A0A1B0G0A7_GLOMM
MATGNVRNIDIVEKCENHDCSSDFFHVLNTMRIDRKFCDFSLNVDGEAIHVHKLALAIASPYFAAIFGDDRKEKTETFLKINDADLIAVKALVKYIYTGVIILTKDNVEQMLCTSDLFQIEWVKKQCIRFLKQSLNATNCFRVRKFADKQSCKELYDFSHKYIMEHFDDLLEQEDLLLLPFEQIRELVKDEQPRPNTENAYKVSMNWIKHDPDQRKVHLAELISLIRLPLASTQFLATHVVTECLLREDHKCNEFLIQALIFQLTKVDEREAQSSKLTKVDEREAQSSQLTKVDEREAQISQLTKVDDREAQSSQLTKVDDREAQSSQLTKVDDREAQSSQLAKVDDREAQSSQLTKVDDHEALIFQLTKVDDREALSALSVRVTKVDEGKCLCKTQTKERQEPFYVFLVGGSNVDRMCKVYDISRNVVVPISNMRKKRCKNSAISLSGAIYSIGGHNGVEIKDAECYNPIKKQWYDIASTNRGHWDFGICTYNDLVYVVGGEKNSTVESYCSATNKWHLCRSMSIKNHFTTRAALAKNSIYTLNYGHDAITWCMRFDPREGGWQLRNQLKKTSNGFELVAHDHTLFAIGSDGCARLDVRTNQWVSMPSMSFNRHGFSAVMYADDIYVLGGRGNSKFTKFGERYNIRKNTWTIIDTVEMQHYLGGAALISGNFRFNK